MNYPENVEIVASVHSLSTQCQYSEMQKAADAADISVLFLSAGANFLGHFGSFLGHFGNFGSFLG